MDDLLSLLDQWNQEEAYQSIIDTLEERSRTQPLDYALTCQLARAYNNVADLDQPEFRSQLERAEELLRSVAEEGADDPLWLPPGLLPVLPGPGEGGSGLLRTDAGAGPGGPGHGTVHPNVRTIHLRQNLPPGDV